MLILQTPCPGNCLIWLPLKTALISAGILAICGADLDLSEVCSQLMFIKVQLPGHGNPPQQQQQQQQFEPEAAKELESSTL